MFSEIRKCIRKVINTVRRFNLLVKIFVKNLINFVSLLEMTEVKRKLVKIDFKIIFMDLFFIIHS